MQDIKITITYGVETLRGPDYFARDPDEAVRINPAFGYFPVPIKADPEMKPDRVECRHDGDVISFMLLEPHNGR